MAGPASEGWRFATALPVWTPADARRAQQMLLETSDVAIPAEFSWTRRSDRLMVVGQVPSDSGWGDLERWVQPAVDQTCCGFCYAVATATALWDRVAIQGRVPHPPTPGPAPPRAACRAGELSAIELASCITASAEYNDAGTFQGCDGGSIDHALGRFLGARGVARCASPAWETLRCPAAAANAPPELPECGGKGGLRAKIGPESFVLLAHNSAIRQQLLQGPLPAAFRIPKTFVKFGSRVPATAGGSFGGWYPCSGAGPFTQVFMWRGASDACADGDEGDCAGHAVVIVGYLRARTQNPVRPAEQITVNAWVLRNSFGQEWGDLPEAGATGRGFCLYAMTDSGFNGALGIGECNDSIGVCAAVLGCECTAGAAPEAGEVHVAPPVRCTGCRAQRVGAAVFDPSPETLRAAGGCAKVTVSAAGGGEREVRCADWPASRPSVVYRRAADAQYLTSRGSGSQLAEQEGDTGAGGGGGAPRVAATAGAGAAPAEGVAAAPPRGCDGGCTVALAVCVPVLTLGCAALVWLEWATRRGARQAVPRLGSGPTQHQHQLPQRPRDGVRGIRRQP